MKVRPSIVQVAPERPSCNLKNGFSTPITSATARCRRILLATENLGVSVVLPGHVRTRPTEAHVGPLAMIIPAEAAAAIKRGLDRGQVMIAFPRRAHWLVRLASVLPWRLKALATRGDRFHVRKDPNPTASP
jgi:hypothetical protein